jgi:Flp pilus assembly pilin Flp
MGQNVFFMLNYLSNGEFQRMFKSFKVDREGGLMKNIISRCVSFFLNRKGQALVEYSIILVLIAMVVFLMLTQLGVSTNNSYSRMNSAFTSR